MLLPKVSIVSPLLAATVLATHRASGYPTAIPRRVAFGSLLEANGAVLVDGLADDGIVSITDIPSFKETKKALLSHLHACIMSVDDGDVMTQRFPDGTVRRSFATSTTPAGGPQPLQSLDDLEAHSAHSKSESCQQFRSHLTAFRSKVDDATKRFADRLSTEMGSSLPKPLLSSRNAYDGGDYEDIKQVVARAEHLEHFHSYQKSAASDEGTTIEFHTDQGFFIAFTPGLIVSSDPSSEDSVELSDGFFVQDSNGEALSMDFGEEDDLVFMMGDGVNQFINNNLINDQKGIRAASHALTLRAQEDPSKARVWYGRMVLAPSDAYYPGTTSTFGEARQILRDSSEDVPLGIGCSSSNMKAFIDTSRKLDGAEDEPLCPESELFCWFRCMPLEEHDAHTCTERNLGVQCVNPRGQVIPDGKKHGDYYPSCTNNTHETHPYSDYPEIDQQDDTCAAEWAAFSDQKDYDHMVDLTRPDGPTALFYWSVVEDDSGAKKMKARLAFNNVFGWLSMGLAHPEGKHNGMNGGNILVAIPGGDYSPVTGLNTDLEGSIGTYKIHENDSSFRHWDTPLPSENMKAEFEDDGCFTAITFEGDHINGQTFNFDGTDEFMWAANYLDHYVGYHGRNARSRITINWNTAEMSVFGEESEETDPAEADQVEVQESGASVESSILGLSVFATILGYVIAN